MTGFLAFFLLIGMAILLFVGWSGFQSYRASHWPVVEGKVLKTNLGSSTGTRGQTTYQAKVLYEYEVGGARYQNSRIAFGFVGTSNFSDQMRVISRIQSAEVVGVRYNPYDPESSVLSYGFHKGLKFMLVFGLVWLAFGSGMGLMFWMDSYSDSVLLDNLLSK